MIPLGTKRAIIEETGEIVWLKDIKGEGYESQPIKETTPVNTGNNKTKPGGNKLSRKRPKWENV